MLDALLESKFTIGILTIMLNIWGRHIVDEVSGNEEEYRRNIIIRRLVIFAMCYIATREIITSIALTAGFVILAMGVSRRGPEGMENPKKKEVKIEQPAHDTTAPELFSDK